MKESFHLLPSADHSVWDDSIYVEDGLPVRDSGPWIHTKHRLLTYYAEMFATGMKFR